MEAIKSILTRRSIRSFSDKKVPIDIINKILECGIHAPSSKNTQPWYFVVDTTDKKNIIAQTILKKHNETFAPMNPKTGKASSFYSAKETAKIIKEAPVVIFIFSEALFTGGRKALLDNPKLEYLLSYESEIASISAAIENMLIAANSFGLGGLWCSDCHYIAEEISKAYGQDKDFICAICLGYPKSKIAFNIPRKENFEFVDKKLRKHAEVKKIGRGLH